MGAVAVTIRGTLYDLQSKSSRQVVLQGEAHLTGLEVGGGPIYPEDPGKPPGIWGGGNVPMPTPPIHLGPGGEVGGPPVIGGGPIIPPGIWGPNDPRPGWGLPPVQPPAPPDGEAVKPPPEGGGWGYFPEYGWGYFPKAGQPSPK